METTYYRFELSRNSNELALKAIITTHIENILLLVDFGQGEELFRPDSFTVDLDNRREHFPLFAELQNHLWQPETVVTTKDLLAAERATGDIDARYDIDVLRMTEPRIVFIHDTLQLINRIPLSDRTRLISAVQDKNILGDNPSATVARCFKLHLAALVANVTFYEGARALAPSNFRLRRAIGGVTQLTDETPTHCGDLLLHFLSVFSELFTAEIADTRISAFRLSSYEHWLEPSDGEPFEILGTLSRDCNAKCDFCYVLGNPSNTAIKLQSFSNRGAAAEAQTRLSYFAIGQRLPVPTYDTEEITTHPFFFDACTAIRNASGKCISITTNGYRLTETNIERLKLLAPVDVSLSLNATSPTTRKWLMAGAQERGMAALPLLHKHRVPCAVTVVAWPRVPLRETAESIKYIDNFNVRSISVLLGGYTKYFPNPPEYHIPQFWNEAIDALVHLRTEIDTPLIIQPRLYEEFYRLGTGIGKNIVTGINKMSPAKRAGVRVYDEIIAINDRAMRTRNECQATLALLRERDMQANIRVLRDGLEVTINIAHHLTDSDYLYGKPFNDKFGVHLYGDNIPIRAIARVFELAAKYNARNVLIATSMVVQPFLAKALIDCSFLSADDVTFDLQVVPNAFLGGNIVMGDMLVVDDFLDFVNPYLESNDCDLVLIPSGPFNHGGWWRDMKGQSFELLRRSFRRPVEMVEAKYFE